MPILAILTTPLATANGLGAINQTKKQMEMKKIFFVAIGIACLMASCTKDSTIEQPKVNPFAGREVIFSTNADDNSSRTIYGDEEKTTATDGTITSWYYPVYWKKGDQILVYGKDSKTKATYDVNVENDGTQNFATSLDKVEANGVQWGTNATSDFFAVYPAKDASFNEDGSINTTIAQTQYNVFAAANVDEEGNAAGWVGQPFDTDATNPTMTNAIMYAYTKDASAYELDGNGNIKTDANGDPIPNQKVDLNFKPFSTVLKFRLAGFAANLNTSAVVNVTKITITAPTDYRISGDFTVTPTVTDGKVSATAKASTSDSQNTIEIIPIISTGSYLPITVGQYVEFNVFAMPIADQQILTTGNWTVKVETAMHGNYTCTLKPTANKTLAPGKIHKIAVPAITSLNTVEWDYSKWMTQIPPKVYLSELSVPGTWYSSHSSYQNNTNLTTQYKAGIRGFNLDCRITYGEEGNSNAGQYLVVAGTDGVGTAGYNYDSGDLVLDHLKTIAGVIAEDEYVVVVLTIAEKPLTRDPLFESIIISGTVDPATVIPAITTMLNDNATALKLYTSKIDSNTTVEDVLGKMIVKINTNNSTIANYTYPTNALVSFGSMAMSDYKTENITDIFSSPYTKYYAAMQSASMYWGNTATDLTYYYHQAQKTEPDATNASTTNIPSLKDRMNAIDDIIAKSTEIYDNSTHDAWFQLGIGGYTYTIDWKGSVKASQTGASDTLNPYVQDLIEAKINTDPSPVGIVLMNHATDANGNAIQLVKDIINMNAKFYLKREGGDITTGGTDGSGSGSGSGNTEGGSSTGGETLPDN